MKPKGINPLELHVEKIVMAAAVVIVTALGARQFLLPLNAVTLPGESDPKRPEEIDNYIDQKARQLEAAMQSNRPLEGVSAGEPLATWFQQQFDVDAAEQVHTSVPLTLKVPLKVGGTEVVDMAAQTYADFTPPAPFDMSVTTRQYSLLPEVVETDYPELQDIVGEAEPYDLPVVHAMAKIDGKALRQELESPQEGRRTIPAAWWQDDMAILDVAMERQELQADGSWSAPVVVPHIPGREDLRQRIRNMRPNQKDELLREIMAMGRELYQEPFYGLSDGTAWTIDELKADQPLTSEEEAAVKKYLRALYIRDKAADKIERYERAEERRNDNKKSTSQTQQGRGSAGGGSGEGIGSEGGKGTGSTSSSEKNQKIDTRERLQNELKAAEEALITAKNEVRTLKPGYEFKDEVRDEKTNPRRGSGDEGGYGKGRYGAPGGMPEGGNPEGGEFVPLSEGGGKGGGYVRPRSSRDPRRAAEAAALLDNDKHEIWTHDISVKPGKTYRYRMMVMYYNPFYGREARLDQSQRGLADSLVYASIPTEWSEPIRVSPPQQFFAVGGSTDASIGERRATFEVYLFSGGEHRVAKMSVSPGDPIGEVKYVTDALGNQTEVDFFTGAVLLDVLPGKKSSSGMSESVQVVVALEDGTIVTLDSEAQQSDPQRERLRDAVEKSAKS